MYSLLKSDKFQHMRNSCLISCHGIQCLAVIGCQECLYSICDLALILIGQGYAQFLCICLNQIVLFQLIQQSISHGHTIYRTASANICVHEVLTKHSSICILHIGLLITQIKIQFSQWNRSSIHTDSFCTSIYRMWGTASSQGNCSH